MHGAPFSASARRTIDLTLPPIASAQDCGQAFDAF